MQGTCGVGLVLAGLLAACSGSREDFPIVCTIEFPCGPEDPSKGGPPDPPAPDLRLAASEERPGMPGPSAPPSDPAPNAGTPTGPTSPSPPSDAPPPPDERAQPPGDPRRPPESTPCRRNAFDSYQSCVARKLPEYEACRTSWKDEADPFCKAQAAATRVFGSDLAASSYGKICVSKRLKDKACVDAVTEAKQTAVYNRCIREILEGGDFYDRFPGRARDSESGDLDCDASYLRPCRNALSNALGKCRP